MIHATLLSWLPSHSEAPSMIAVAQEERNQGISLELHCHSLKVPHGTPLTFHKPEIVHGPTNCKRAGKFPVCHGKRASGHQ